MKLIYIYYSSPSFALDGIITLPDIEGLPSPHDIAMGGTCQKLGWLLGLGLVWVSLWDGKAIRKDKIKRLKNVH